MLVEYLSAINPKEEEYKQGQGKYLYDTTPIAICIEDRMSRCEVVGNSVCKLSLLFLLRAANRNQVVLQQVSGKVCSP
jgi:hypothetical protein